ncbi:MAG: class I SAM-dependent DNA methyltransferase, partial [Anaerolineaceae bacterium]
MNNAHLQDLIKDFSPQKLVPFLREKNRNFRPTPERLSDLDLDQFSQGEKIGEIPFSQYENLGIYAIKVTRNLTERTGKKDQYDLAKKILKESEEDAGIFVFYDAEGSFRFSLVYANYLGTKRDWSTFRRFTYFVSPQLTNKTF